VIVFVLCSKADYASLVMVFVFDFVLFGSKLSFPSWTTIVFCLLGEYRS